MTDKAGLGDFEREAPRRRARHKNSHTGCLTCKRRHVKCDEAKPSCERCRIANKKCILPPVIGGGSAQIPNTLPSSEFYDSQGYADTCVQHFERVTLPAFHRCEPSSLWGYLRTEIPHSSSIRSLAEALGHEHRAAVDPTFRDIPAALELYPKAVYSLRQTIADAEFREKQITVSTVVFHCLLLVILQCFRRAFDELNIHLRHGLRLASQALTDPPIATHVPLNECLRLLKQYSVSVALFNPLLPQDRLSPVLTTTNQALSDPEGLKTLPSVSILREDDQVFKDEVQDLVLDLIGITLTYRKPIMNRNFDGSLEFDKPFVADAALVAAVTKLRARHATMTLAIQQRLRSKHASRTQHLRLGEATMILIGIYLRCRWSGYQCNWDLEIPNFADIVEKIRTILEHEELLSRQENASTLLSSAFSIGFGSIAPLFYVALMCRAPAIRRAAVELLSKCPRQDGPWNARLAGVVCTTIINFEERKAAAERGAGYALTGYIPEHCRVAYYYYFQVTEAALGQIEGEYVRVYRKRSGIESMYVHEDLELESHILSLPVTEET